ncbi:MAG: hypothetical protein EBS55_15035, partial [Flavobacteriaceae bacterium]|nr:hypothetical protein [Flavobacteriaceae bacterium]
MRRIVRLTESDLVRIINKTINESQNIEDMHSITDMFDFVIDILSKKGDHTLSSGMKKFRDDFLKLEEEIKSELSLINSDIEMLRSNSSEDSLCEVDPKIKVDIETGKQNNNPARAAEEFMTYGWKKYTDPTKVKEGYDVQIKWFGHIGYLGNAIARRELDL